MRRARVTLGVLERIARAGFGFGLAPLGLVAAGSADSRGLASAGVGALAAGMLAAVSGVTGVRLERAVLWWRRRRRPPNAVRVRVSGRYEPDTIVAAAGEPLRITFHREDTLACSEHVVFPAFGKSAMLPTGEDVTVDLVPERPGEYEFTCQLGVLRGRLVVTGGARRRRARLARP